MASKVNKRIREEKRKIKEKAREEDYRREKEEERKHRVDKGRIGEVGEREPWIEIKRTDLRQMKLKKLL